MRDHRWILFLLLAGCSGAKGGDKDGYYGYYGDYAGSSADTDASDGAPADVSTPAPEEEDDQLALPPAQTDVYVFIPNPDRDTVTRLDVRTLEVRTAAVGSDPTIVKTTPDWTAAVVFNRADDSVTILDADTLEGDEVAVRDDFNQMVMSPDGAFVVLWHDIAAERADDPPADGLQSFNECSFVRVATREHFPMAVGFNPKDVVFTPDGALATVVSDQYLAVVDLTADVPAPRLIAIAEDLVDPLVAEEVVVAPSGDFAFVRQFGATDVLVVDLVRGVVDAVPVGANPTDLDLTPDGRTAAVVARESGELHLIDTADPFAPPRVVPLPPGSVYGSILYAPTGETAALYTTASLVDRYATLDVASGRITERSLEKPVASMAITPTGESMLVFHTLADAPDADTSSPFHGEWALTVVSLDDFRTNPLLLPAEPIGYANASNGEFGYFIMDGQNLLEVIDYTTLLHDEVPLASPPLYVGVLPDLDAGDGVEPPAWVSQEHHLGRITLYDPVSHESDTITGFELNSAIED